MDNLEFDMGNSYEFISHFKKKNMQKKLKDKNKENYQD